MTKKYLVTSALPYINGVKHLGNLVGSMLPADVYARYLRQKGEEVLYICATDEHGTPAEIAAAEEKMTPREYCDKYHQIQKDIYDGFGIRFDYFGRTSSEQNTVLTQHFCEKLVENGFIEKRMTKQVYSHADGRFLPDRYVEGTCPHCGYEKARGDQCDKCTTLLDPTELINPRSAISGSEDLEVKESAHLFLLLPKLEKEVTAWIDEKEKEGLWPAQVVSIARKWIKEGLRERGITRDLKWGVPVNYPGLEDKVFYVWFDAPIGYIAATKQWADEDPAHRDYMDWWTESPETKYVEFMAKDNVAFHTIYFPATLMGSGENWKKVDVLKGFNWLNYYGGKFSTSQHRGIFADQALEEFDADYWRYWLMANAPESDDVSFSIESFVATVNKDLNDVLGNFINRVLKMTAKSFGDEVPSGGSFGPEEERLFQELDGLLKNYSEALDKLEFRKALGFLRELWVAGNNYIARTEPWKAVKEDKDRGAVILRTGLNLIRLYAAVSKPVIPGACEKMATALNLSPEEEVWPDKPMKEYLAQLPAGHAIHNIDPLFSKISDERAEELKARYGAGEEGEK